VALNRGQFHPDWAKAHAPVVESAMRATVRIELPGTPSYDFDAGTTSETTDLFYEGKARVQKVAHTVRREFIHDAADQQRIRVQIPLGSLAAGKQWVSNLRVTVTACPDRPDLVGLVCYVRGWAGSSNDWDITLLCFQNAKDPA
jgi:hypothetical protein